MRILEVTEAMAFSTGEVIPRGEMLVVETALSYEERRRLEELATRSWPCPSVWVTWGGRRRVVPLHSLRDPEREEDPARFSGNPSLSL